MKNNTLSPILLFATFPANSAGLMPPSFTSSVPPLEIYNPNKTAMLVDQLRFRVSSPLATPSTGFNQDGQGYDSRAGGAIGIEILLGSIPLTNRTVTLGALCPRYIAQSTRALRFNGYIDGPGNDPVFVWHLPKPLYVPPLVQLTIRMVRQPLYPTDTPQLDLFQIVQGLSVAVVGRSLPSDFPVPGEIDVPFVTETQNNNPALTRFVSKDSDLVNKSNVPLDVVMFTGYNTWFGRETEVVVSPNPTFTVQMTASNGTMLIRDPVPFLAVFPSSKNILPLSARLQPGEFFRAELECVADTPAFGLYNLAFTAIAMHGSRKVQTPGTLG